MTKSFKKSKEKTKSDPNPTGPKYRTPSDFRTKNFSKPKFNQFVGAKRQTVVRQHRG